MEALHSLLSSYTLFAIPLRSGGKDPRSPRRWGGIRPLQCAFFGGCIVAFLEKSRRARDPALAISDDGDRLAEHSAVESAIFGASAAYQLQYLRLHDIFLQGIAAVYREQPPHGHEAGYRLLQLHGED